MLEAAKPEQVRARYLRYATHLTRAGIEWQQPDNESLCRSASRLISQEITQGRQVSVGRDDGLVVATDPGGEVVAALTFQGGFFGGTVVVFLRHLAVAPSWRRRGLGAVGVGLVRGVAEQSSGHKVDLIIGNCSSDTAPFYADSGFTVLDPGQALPFPFGEQAVLKLNDTDTYNRFMFR